MSLLDLSIRLIIRQALLYRQAACSVELLLTLNKWGEMHLQAKL